MNAFRTPGRLTRRSISIGPTGNTHRHHSFWRRGEGARDHYSFGDLAFYGWRTRIEVGEEGGDRTSRARSLTAPRPVTTTAGQDLFYWVQFDYRATGLHPNKHPLMWCPVETTLFRWRVRSNADASFAGRRVDDAGTGSLRGASPARRRIHRLRRHCRHRRRRRRCAAKTMRTRGS